MLSKKIIKIKDLDEISCYSCPSGAFFVLYYETFLDDYAPTCREEFADLWRNNQKMVGMACIPNNKFNFKSMLKFWSFIEKKLKLPKKQRLTFFRTNLPKHQSFVVKVPSFWMKDELRKSLFSLFLRCSAIYSRRTKNVFWGAINKYYLTSSNSVKKAIEYFLNGHTKTVKGEIYNSFSYDGFCEMSERVFEDESNVKNKLSLILKK